MLQSVAECCRVLQSVAVCCSVLPLRTTCTSSNWDLGHVAVCCRVLQRVVVCCSAVQWASSVHDFRRHTSKSMLACLGLSTKSLQTQRRCACLLLTITVISAKMRFTLPLFPRPWPYWKQKTALQHTATHLFDDAFSCDATHHNIVPNSATQPAHLATPSAVKTTATTHCQTLQHTAIYGMGWLRLVGSLRL